MDPRLDDPTAPAQAPTRPHPAVPPRSNPAAQAAPSTLQVGWARHADEVRAAQRLRYQVFAEELGAQLSPPPGTPAGLDVDAYDAHCEHLIVRTAATAHHPGEVVGTYRVLTPAGARLVGQLYTDTEFDLAPLESLRPRLAELGRSCTAPGWRQGGVILMLWASLAAFMHRNGLDLMIGCASVPMRDGGHGAASLWTRLADRHLAPPALRVSPRTPLPIDHLDTRLEVEPPPLVKGYLRCGAQILGAPAWDPAFGVADLPLLLDLERLPPAYRQRFLAA